MARKKRQSPTAQQRDAAAIAAIRRRLVDMLSGAYGGYGRFDRAEEAGIMMLGVEAFARFVGAVQRAWLSDGQGEIDITNPLTHAHCLEHYDTFDSLAGWLHGLGKVA